MHVVFQSYVGHQARVQVKQHVYELVLTKDAFNKQFMSSHFKSCVIIHIWSNFVSNDQNRS